MEVALLFLSIPLTCHSEFFDVYAPDDYLNYRNDIFKQEDTNIVNTIRYNELLSLLHNEYSNKAVLDHISNPEVKNSDNVKVPVHVTNVTEKVTTDASTDEFKDNTRLDVKDWNRWKRENRNDKYVNLEFIPLKVPVNIVREDQAYDVNAANNATDHEQDSKTNKSNITKVLKENFNTTMNTSNKNDTQKHNKHVMESNKTPNEAADKIEIIVDEKPELNSTNNKDIKKRTEDDNTNNKRPKRHTSLKLLRNLFHPSSTTIKPQDTPRNLVEHLNSTHVNLIEELTTSIKLLNQYLVNLKLNFNENLGFVMIKVPIDKQEGKKYLENMPHNETKTNLFRIKRDAIKDELDENKLNNTFNEMNIQENDTTSSNITNNSDTIVEKIENKTAITSKPENDILVENVERTIVSDSEIYKKLNDFNKSKRETNATVLESLDINNSNKSDTSNNTEKFNSTRRFNTESNIKEQSKTKKDPQHDDKKSNGTKTKPTRKFYTNRDDLLFFIQKAYDDIKSLIAPINYLRDKYSENVLYKIGYIISTLDTMDKSFEKMKSKILSNSLETNTKKLQRMHKKLMLSKKLVQNVMEFLNNIYADSQLVEK